MRDPPTFLIDSEGRIEGQNPSATEEFGNASGRFCRHVLAAHNGAGRAICRADCAKELHDTSGHRVEEPAVIGRRRRRLTCSCVGERSIVTIFDAPDAPDVSEPLTRRELEVLGLVAQGLTSRRIARRLRVSFSTVRTHIERARSKLGARSRAEAVATAIRTGQLVEPTSD